MSTTLRARTRPSLLAFGTDPELFFGPDDRRPPRRRHARDGLSPGLIHGRDVGAAEAPERLGEPDILTDPTGPHAFDAERAVVTVPTHQRRLISAPIAVDVTIDVALDLDALLANLTGDLLLVGHDVLVQPDPLLRHRDLLGDGALLVDA